MRPRRGRASWLPSRRPAARATSTGRSIPWTTGRRRARREHPRRVPLPHRPGVKFVDRPGGSPTTETTIVGKPHSPELSASPGRIGTQSSAFDDTRKPLVGEFKIKNKPYFLIVNHFSSKGEDQPLFGPSQPPVEAQRGCAARPGAGRQRLRGRDPRARPERERRRARRHQRLRVLRDGEHSRGRRADDATRDAHAQQRYSYVFEGNSQVLDQILVSNRAGWARAAVRRRARELGVRGLDPGLGPRAGPDALQAVGSGPNDSEEGEGGGVIRRLLVRGLSREWRGRTLERSPCPADLTRPTMLRQWRPRGGPRSRSTSSSRTGSSSSWWRTPAMPRRSACPASSADGCAGSAARRTCRSSRSSSTSRTSAPAARSARCSTRALPSSRARSRRALRSRRRTPMRRGARTRPPSSTSSRSTATSPTSPRRPSDA